MVLTPHSGKRTHEEAPSLSVVKCCSICSGGSCVILDALSLEEKHSEWVCECWVKTPTIFGGSSGKRTCKVMRLPNYLDVVQFFRYPKHPNFEVDRQGTDTAERFLIQSGALHCLTLHPRNMHHPLIIGRSINWAAWLHFRGINAPPMG